MKVFLHLTLYPSIRHKLSIIKSLRRAYSDQMHITENSRIRVLFAAFHCAINHHQQSTIDYPIVLDLLNSSSNISTLPTVVDISMVRSLVLSPDNGKLNNEIFEYLGYCTVGYPCSYPTSESNNI